MKNKILFIAGTHGDEKIGVDVLKEVEKDFKINWIKGNEKALLENKRYLKHDLNRVAPGDAKSKDYETLRAYQILKVSNKFDYTIDLHGTTAKSGIFCIVTNPTPGNLMLAASLPIKNIVIWVAKEKEKISPLSEFFPSGLEIECGPKNDLSVKNQLTQIITSIVKNGIDLNKANYSEKSYFRVYGFQAETDIASKTPVDFKKYTHKNEVFYPILSGQYKGIAYYKMEKMDFIQSFAY